MTRTLGLALMVATLAPWSAGHAQDQATLIRAPRMLDVRNGRLVQDAEVLVQNGRIVRAEPRSDAAAPSGTRVVTLPDLTLIPGLIDAHVHLSPVGSSAARYRDPGSWAISGQGHMPTWWRWRAIRWQI